MWFFQKNNRNTDWVEGSFSFDAQVGRQVAAPTSSAYIGSSLSKKKAILFVAVIGLIFFFIMGKIFLLQIIHGGQNRLSAERNRERLIPIPAERGIVYDRNGIELTKNIPNFSLAIVPQDLPRKQTDLDEVTGRLAAISGHPTEDIQKIINAYKSYQYESIVVADDIDYNTALSILIQSADLPGISIQRGGKRQYLLLPAQAFAPILGYVGKLSPEDLQTLYLKGYLPSDVVGKTGVEKTYETALRGTYGKKRIEVDATGHEQAVLSEEPPIPGNHLKLTIDSAMQLSLAHIMSTSLAAQRKFRAAGIVMNPNNGEILAMVNLPSYNDNDFSGGIDQATYESYISDPNEPLFTRAWSGAYPSGSTIKPAIAAAALQEEIITPRTSFLSTGGLQVAQWFFPDWQAGGHGLTNVRKSLAWSVNTFYYYIGGGFGTFAGLGVEKITNYMRKWHFASPLGLDLPGEGAGFLPSKDWKTQTKREQWYIGDTYNISIGQGDVLVTPLQIAAMTATVANGGTVYWPHVGRAIVDAIKKEEQPIEPKILNQNFIDQKNMREVQLGMRDCVTYGSCRSLSDLPFAAAGKTGTAQWNTGKANHAWFTSFAPFERPQIVVTILVEEGGEGSAAAAPIAKQFYTWWWNYTHRTVPSATVDKHD